MAKKRKKRRHRRFGGGIIMKILSAFVICVAILGAMTVFFKIETITITGEHPYNPQDIIDSSQIAIGDNTFFVNKFTAISKIFEKHPYLDTINMRRHLPSQLEIIVTQCVPVAVVHGIIAPYYIDVNGKILQQAENAESAKLVDVVGIEPGEMEVGQKINFVEKEKEKNLLNLLNELRNYDIIDKVETVDLEKLYNVVFQYKEQFTVHLGTSDNITGKLKLMLAVEGQLGPQERGVIDVSDSENIRFRPN